MESFAEKSNKKKYSLAVETAVEGGSLALFENGAFVDGWVCEGTTARGEEILIAIKKLLEKNAASKNQIGRITISNGPGSFTGARVGAATARGLSRSLGCALRGRSVLEALATNDFFDGKAYSAGVETETAILTAMPFGKYAVCLQRFVVDSRLEIVRSEAPAVIERLAFEEILKISSNERTILHGTLYRQMHSGVEKETGKNLKGRKIVDAGFNIAALLAGCERHGRNELANHICEISPIYVR